MKFYLILHIVQLFFLLNTLTEKLKQRNCLKIMKLKLIIYIYAKM